MKILVLGSYARSLLLFRGSLIADMVEAGHEVIASAPNLADDVVDGLSALGARAIDVPMQRTGTNPFGDIRYYRSLKRLIREEKPDVLFAYTMKPVIWGSLAMRETDGRAYSLITGLGYAFSNSGLRNRFLGTLVRHLLRTALRSNSAVIFQNPDDESEFELAGILPGGIEAVRVNGSGVDVNHFAVTPLPAGTGFLMIARLLEDKGVREYVDAARIVRRRFSSARFELAGWLDENPRCIPKRELDIWCDEGVIEWLGHLDDVRPAIERCSVYVLPSWREGMPRTNLEAMSMGRAVITTDVPGCRETVIDGENGRLVPAQDAAALASAMLRFLNGQDSAETMGRRGREIAEDRFDVRKVNRRLMQVMAL